MQEPHRPLQVETIINGKVKMSCIWLRVVCNPSMCSVSIKMLMTTLYKEYSVILKC